MARDEEREIVYVERGDGSFRPMLFGALVGLAIGLLFAPQSGEETRRGLRRRLRKARALAEEKVGEISERMSGEWPRGERSRREESRDEVRSELERRLAEARTRRRTTASAGEEEEPVA